MTRFSTQQEEFWFGEFGDDYTGRNSGVEWMAANTALFADILRRTDGVRSVLEVGANRGLNLRALRTLLPRASLTAVEINPTAAEELRAWGEADVHEGSILEVEPPGLHDLVLTKGVLIHLDPDRLDDVYARLVEASARYLCLVEYYNPVPAVIPYRGHEDRLFKRDFAGEVMDAHRLRLVDYGFTYRRDPNFPQDDTTWFLLEKQG